MYPFKGKSDKNTYEEVLKVFKVFLDSNRVIDHVNVEDPDQKKKDEEKKKKEKKEEDEEEDRDFSNADVVPIGLPAFQDVNWRNLNTGSRSRQEQMEKAIEINDEPTFYIFGSVFIFVFIVLIKVFFFY